ncbi:Lipocalin [Pelobates cultripes]|uniref:Lipocalin n=1 Tax=Pelobates cultripes TaxID=61616 RepID=A0AAD1T2L5_PELCU|nr:Lipocalin [Pelobates cultripes]
MAILFQITGLVLFLCLQVRADIPAQKDFKPDKITGKWYSVAAASNCTEFLKMKDSMTRPIILFQNEPDNSLKCSIAYMTPKGCQGMSFSYKFVSEGHYTYTDPRGNTAVTFVGTDYTSFALEFAATVPKNGQKIIMIKLYGREKSLPKDVRDQFEKFVFGFGLNKHHLIYFPDAEECVPGTF